jgi:hypothetical protein
MAVERAARRSFVGGRRVLCLIGETKLFPLVGYAGGLGGSLVFRRTHFAGEFDLPGITAMERV